MEELKDRYEIIEEYMCVETIIGWSFEPKFDAGKNTFYGCGRVSAEIVTKLQNSIKSLVIHYAECVNVKSAHSF